MTTRGKAFRIARRCWFDGYLVITAYPSERLWSTPAVYPCCQLHQ